MKRIIIERYEMAIYHDDRDVVGYLVGGDLVINEPDAETKDNFCGDWSDVRLCDVWSIIHNGDRKPVIFHDWNNKEHMAYYPHWNDTNRFRVVRFRMI